MINGLGTEISDDMEYSIKIEGNTIIIEVSTATGRCY
jgi:hypothetical protein